MGERDIKREGGGYIGRDRCIDIGIKRGRELVGDS